jgi:hypothetical protein
MKLNDGLLIYPRHVNTSLLSINLVHTRSGKFDQNNQNRTAFNERNIEMLKGQSLAGV